MIRLLLITSLLFSLGCQAIDCSTYTKLSVDQKERLAFSFREGKTYNLGYTLAAIALSESSAGKYRLNIHSKDLGLYQVNYKTAQMELGITNHYKQLELHQKLIYDDQLGAYVAIKVLQHFDKGNYKEMVMSYNEGYRWRKDKNSYKKALTYYNKVAYNVRMLKRCSKLK